MTNPNAPVAVPDGFIPPFIPDLEHLVAYVIGLASHFAHAMHPTKASNAMVALSSFHNALAVEYGKLATALNPSTPKPSENDPNAEVTTAP
jgi:hypothetical protein